MTGRLRELALRALRAALWQVVARSSLRFVSLCHPERIGHLSIEPDSFIKEGELGLRERFRAVLLVPEGRTANRALARIWAGRLSVVTSDFWCRFLEDFAARAGRSYSTQPYVVAINDTARSAAINAGWGERPPVVTLPEELRARGRAALRGLGLPEGAWFVCVHSREGEYSPSDEHLHSFRNSDIGNYVPAMRAVVERGGWCVRVGEASTRPLAPMPGVIDYAHSAAKSDWMDVYLCADCRFFLGNSSGLYTVADVFGGSSALANMISGSGTLPLGARDLGIPKLLRWKAGGKLLRFEEILGSPIANFRFASQYEEAGVLVEENSAEEIRDLALEMLERAEGRAAYTAEDEALQQRFRALLRPGHYCYGAASRVGRAFLRKYAALL